MLKKYLQFLVIFQINEYKYIKKFSCGRNKLNHNCHSLFGISVKLKDKLS